MTPDAPRSHESDLYRADLRSFIEAAWPIVEPAQPLQWNWHLDVLCDVLGMVTAGEIDRLIINVPPGCMKSLMVSVFWPAWEWASNPGLRYLTFSYSQDLTTRDNGKVRAIITSEWYRRLFPELTLAPDQNTKLRFDTTEQGWRIATSMGGRGTGEHPDRVIIDDPHSARDATGIEMLNQVATYDGTISTRGRSRGAPHILIAQRFDDMDLTAHLLAKGGWHHICLPMRFEPDLADPLDERTEAGDLLWPALFDEAAVRAMEIDLGPYGAAGQLQQRPAPIGGGLFKSEWFDIVDAAPVGARAIRGWDTAATEGAGDYTRGVKISGYHGLFFVESVVGGQLSAFGVDKLISDTAKVDGRAVAIREEQEPGASGKSVIAQRVRMLAGHDYRGVAVSGDKVTRASGFRAQCEAGNVKIVRGAWNSAYLAELCVFPAGAHDDQVDASSCAFNELTSGPGKVTSVPVRWG